MAGADTSGNISFILSACLSLLKAQEILSLCAWELSNYLSFTNDEMISDTFRLLYHVHKTHMNYLIEGFLKRLAWIQMNQSELTKDKFEENYRSKTFLAIKSLIPHRIT